MLVRACAGLPGGVQQGGGRRAEVGPCELFVVLRRGPAFFDYQYDRVSVAELPCVPERGEDADAPRQLFEGSLAIGGGIALRTFHVILERDIGRRARFAHHLPDGTAVWFGAGAARAAVAAEIAAARPQMGYVPVRVTDTSYLSQHTSRLTVGDATRLIEERCPGWKLLGDGTIVRC